MSVSVKVYDWPNVIPSKQLFFSGGQAFEGGFTSGGAKILTPEPGGRSFLSVEFGYQKHGSTDTSISWLCSKIANGSIFRVPIVKTPQLVSLPDLGITGAPELAGVPWAAEGLIPAHPWDNGQNWAYEVGALAASIALEGAVTLTLDMGDLEPALRHGHVIGHGDVPYLVDDIEYDGQIATITVDPPLRADLSAGSYITFRPTMLCVADNPENFRGLYEPADLIKLGSARFIEAIV